MELKSSDLPGVGKKFTLDISENCVLVVIIYHNGKRELYFLKDEDAEEPIYTTTLSDEDSRMLATILMGVDYQPVTERQAHMLHGQILVEWLEVSDNSQLVGKSIAETELRSKMGVTILGIERNGDLIGSPDIDEIIKKGDVLMVSGKKENINKVQNCCRGSLNGTQ